MDGCRFLRAKHMSRSQDGWMLGLTRQGMVLANYVVRKDLSTGTTCYYLRKTGVMNSTSPHSFQTLLRMPGTHTSRVRIVAYFSNPIGHPASSCDVEDRSRMLLYDTAQLFFHELAVVWVGRAKGTRGHGHGESQCLASSRYRQPGQCRDRRRWRADDLPRQAPRYFSVLAFEWDRTWKGNS